MADYVDVPASDYVDVPIDDYVDVLPTPKEQRIAARSGLEEFGRHALATIPRIAANIPGAVGLISAAATTPMRMVQGDGLSDAFVKGLDNPFTHATQNARAGINSALDIEEPQTVAGQILGTLAESIIPVAGTIGGRTNAITQALSKTLPALPAKAVRDAGIAAEVLLPLVTIDKARPLASAVSVGLQSGLSLGVDQAARAYLDRPEMPTLAEAARREGYLDPKPVDPVAAIDTTQEAAAKEIVYKSLWDKYLAETATVAGAAFAAKHRISGYAQAKLVQSLNQKSMFGQAIHQEPTKPGMITELSAIADQQAYSRDYLQRINKQHEGMNAEILANDPTATVTPAPFTTDDIHRIDGKNIVDSGKLVQDFMHTARLGTNQPRAPEAPVAIMRDIQALREAHDAARAQVPGATTDYQRLNEYAYNLAEQQNRVYAQVWSLVEDGHPNAGKYLNTFENQGHDATVAALRADGLYHDPMNPNVMQTNLTPATGLLKSGTNRLWFDSELDLRARDIRTHNPEVHEMVKRISAPYRALMESSRDVFGDAVVDKLIKQHTINGDFIFVPRQENAGRVDMFGDIKHALGYADEPTKIDLVRTMRERATSAWGGIIHPINVDDMMPTYIDKTIKYIQHERLKAEIGRTIESTTWLDPKLQAMAFPIGKFDLYGNSKDPSKIYDPTGMIKRGMIGKNDAKEILADPTKHFRYMRDGEIIAIAVPHEGMRHALEHNPHLLTKVDGVANTMRQFTQTMTTGGWWNAFAPVSALFNTGAVLLNKGNLKFNPVLDNIRGFNENFKSSMLYTMSNAFERLGRIQGQQGNHWTAKAALMRHKLDQTFTAQADALGYGMRDRIDYDSAVHGLLDRSKAYIPYLTSTKGQVYSKLVWDTLTNFSESIKAATKTGAVMRNLTGMSDDEISSIMSRVAKVEGRMHAKSASSFVRGMNAWVPYNNVAVQELAALGASAKNNPIGTMMGLTSIAIMPTVAEYMIASSLSTDEQKKFYNNIPASDRARNWYVPALSGVANDWHVFPVPPIVSFVRASTQGFLESTFGQIGSLEQQAPDRDMYMAMMRGLGRSFNVSVPPVVNLFLASQGLRMPDGAFGGVTDIAGNPGLGSDSYDYNTQTDAFTNTTTAGLIAIGGGTMQTAIDVANAYGIGSRAVSDQQPASVMGGIDRSLDKLGDKYLAKLPGTLRWVSSNPHSTDMAKNVQAVDDALKGVLADLDAKNRGHTLANGGQSPDGAINVNDTETYAAVMYVAHNFRGPLQKVTKDMSDINQYISRLKATPFDMTEGKPLSLEGQKGALEIKYAELQDAITRKAAMHRVMENQIKDMTGKDIDLASLKASNVKRSSVQQQPAKNLGL